MLPHNITLIILKYEFNDLIYYWKYINLFIYLVKKETAP